jgi:hypothetical protein
MSDLAIVQKTYDTILWYAPIVNRLPREHKFTLGDRIVTGYILDLSSVGTSCV